jgi:hypothetical protein
MSCGVTQLIKAKKSATSEETGGGDVLVDNT